MSSLVMGNSGMAISGQVMAFGCDEIIQVPNGEIKSYSKSLLKAQGPGSDFVLFNNLPLELRSKIYPMALPSRVIAFVEVVTEAEDFTPNRRFKVLGASRPAILAASKEAAQIIIRSGAYQPRFGMNNGANIYFNSEVDMIRLTSEAVMANNLEPFLTLPMVMGTCYHLTHIKVLSLDLFAIDNFKTWGMANLNGIKCLEKLMISGVMAETRPDIIELCIRIQIEGPFMEYFVTEKGQVLQDGAALEACQDRLYSAVQKSRLEAILGLVDDLMEVKLLPAEVVLSLRYMPLQVGQLSSTALAVQGIGFYEEYVLDLRLDVWSSFSPAAPHQATPHPCRRTLPANEGKHGPVDGARFMYYHLRHRFCATILEINDTLLNMALDPRLMPGVAAEMRSVRSSASTPSLRSRDSVARMDPGGNVKVVVRVRGFLPRELDRGAECLVHMNPMNQATTLLVPNDTDPANTRSKARKVIEEKHFTFDNSFWSHDKEDEHYAHQEDVYNALGEEFLDHNFEGYHTCIFAYGQTGSGKSYTMMGTADQPGLIPRTCQDLFERIEAAHEETPNISYNVRVSYFEVYNEHVRDLLVPVQPNQPPYYLKIRESPTEGPYIKDLTDAPVRNINEIMKYMKMGDANRTTASTKMNDTSSRSHSVFTIMLKQIHHDMDTDETTERIARIRLVDLAGSERAKATEATGTRLREGSNINKSLTTLGRVIAALADPKQSRPGKRNRDIVPYRDSILTWLLKDSLGGNSKTAMIACIAPSDYDETLSTLRYADQAKRIRTRAVVNQDHVSAAERDAQIAAMAEEIRLLQQSVAESRRREKEGKESEEKTEEYQLRMAEMQRMMEEKAMISDSKIKNLQTVNDALRLHLKLLLDERKNPIEVRSARNSMYEGSRKGSMAEQGVQNEEDKENDDTTEVPDEEYPDEDEGIDVSAHQERANETQDYMEELLKDLSLFRRKIGDDKSRFITPLGERINKV